MDLSCDVANELKTPPCMHLSLWVDDLAALELMCAPMSTAIALVCRGGSLGLNERYTDIIVGVLYLLAS